MKKQLILFVLILFGIGFAYSQGFGYSYSTRYENVQTETPIAGVGADRPNDIWAVSGNLQPFGTCQTENNISAYNPMRKGPSGTGGEDPGKNPSLEPEPIGDVDWVCGLLLGAYILGRAVRRQRKAKEHNQPLCD